MRLFLPYKGWHCKFKVEDELEELPSKLFSEIEEANTNIMEEPPGECVLEEKYKIEKLVGNKHLRWVKEAWFWTSNEGDPDFPEDTTGEEIEVCMGHSLVFRDYEKALKDLAKVHEPVATLVALVKSGPEAARPVARAVLDGDRASLTVLADALEETGHAKAKEVRDLAGAEKKAKKAQGGRGRPLPEGLAPAKKGAKKGAAQPAGPKVTTIARGTGLEVVLVGGMPSAGKTTLVQALLGDGYERLNRDEAGGSVDDLLPRLDAALAAGRSAVLDNLYATRDSRAGAVRAAKARGARVRFVRLDTSLEDSQFNACLRMIEKCGRVLHPEDHKKTPYRSDNSLYPVAVFYKYRNDYQEPSTSEGFDAVETVNFVRRYPAEWAHKAVIFDFDGTLRTHVGKEKYPVSPKEVRAFIERAAKLREMAAQGYLILGASNQSGVARGHLSADECRACFDETVRQLGVPFADVLFCPHRVPPLSCYCRKPNPGMGVELIARHELDPRQCLYVGDQGTDRSFAERCGFRFVEQAEFFGG
jgi:HAD superfamily hydrolase (TIGR01662 family)